MPHNLCNSALRTQVEIVHEDSVRVEALYRRSDWSLALLFEEIKALGGCRWRILECASARSPICNQVA
jgi:hypothetical protein